ncbi:hypothetical protein [Gluconobacter morbifer]|uniref:hypothetical protein n=1 Tax=Gluconobacter morbifer TaxID=479935 RepID=UPI00058B5EC5|nr:hypothetical protein [Gluconobacter morbifer]
MNAATTPNLLMTKDAGLALIATSKTIRLFPETIEGIDYAVITVKIGGKTINIYSNLHICGYLIRYFE